MGKIFVKDFDGIDFFLSSYVLVDSLDEGAKKYGGATMINNLIYSNIEKNEFIQNYEDSNVIYLFVPSTLYVDFYIDSTVFRDDYKSIIESNYPYYTTKLIEAKGSWFSTKLNKVVIEDIKIISLKLNRPLVNEDIQFFISLANKVKEEMHQENVSVTINNSLLII